jgi:hypothetical protein
MKIEFDYINNTNECSLESEHHACCCQCIHQLEARKHCCHSPSENKCVCKDPLGFYVCVVWHDIEGGVGANLCGEHGFCEEFIPRTREGNQK